MDFVEQEVSNLNVLGIMHQGEAGEVMLNPLTNLGFIIFRWYLTLLNHASNAAITEGENHPRAGSIIHH